MACYHTTVFDQSSIAIIPVTAKILFLHNVRQKLIYTPLTFSPSATEPCLSKTKMRFIPLSESAVQDRIKPIQPITNLPVGHVLIRGHRTPSHALSSSFSTGFIFQEWLQKSVCQIWAAGCYRGSWQALSHLNTVCQSINVMLIAELITLYATCSGVKWCGVIKGRRRGLLN